MAKQLDFSDPIELTNFITESLNREMNESTPSSLEDLISQYRGDAKIANVVTNPGRRGNPATIVTTIGVKGNWHKALVSNILRYKFATKIELNDDPIVTVTGFDKAITIVKDKK